MMFDFTISISHVITICGFAAAFVWNWFTLKTKADEALKKANEATTKLSTLELQLIREYASLTNMQSVENRLSSQIVELTGEIRELRRFLMEGKKNV